MNKQKELELIVQMGFALLEKEKAYGQVNIVRKLKALNLEVSPAALNKIINNNGGGKKTLTTCGEGIRQIVELELGYQYDANQLQFIIARKDGWVPYTIPEQSESEEENTGKAAHNQSIIYHQDGRLPIHDKVAFMLQAQHNIIEVGIRLRTFSEYFTSRNQSEFRGPIEELLEKGIHFDAYLLDPESNESRIYFNDREKVQKGEMKGTDVIKGVLEQLQDIQLELQTKQYPGKFGVFAYKHIPYNHFLVIDGDTPFGRMMISHYLYGIRRADCPVIEFSRKDHKSLYDRYWKSLQVFIKDANKLV